MAGRFQDATQRASQRRRLGRDRAPGPLITLAPGAIARWRGHRGVVARLDGAHAVVEFNGRLWRVPLGELE
jgi:hypothetical protein